MLRGKQSLHQRRLGSYFNEIQTVGENQTLHVAAGL